MAWPWPRGGTQEQRKVTLKDEILRIIFCCALVILFSAIIIGLFVVQAMIVGPLLGVVLCAILAFLLATGPLGRLAYEADPENYKGYVLGMTLACELVVGIFSYPILEAIWPPRIPWDVPFYALASVFILISITQFVLASGIYLLASEAFDPNGPTATRKPVDYPKTIWPFTPVGQVAEAAPTPAPLPRQVRIHHEKRDNGKARDRYMLLPDSESWRSYARALANGATTFSEASAKRFGISPQDRRDRSTHAVTEYGFRTVRDRLLEQGYISYRDENARNLGYDFTKDYDDLMENWGYQPTED